MGKRGNRVLRPLILKRRRPVHVIPPVQRRKKDEVRIANERPPLSSLVSKGKQNKNQQRKGRN